MFKRFNLIIPVDSTNFSHLGTKYAGKVRDNYIYHDNRFIITTDRISAFDQVLGTIPLKGQVLTKLSHWWFDQTKDLVPNHIISMMDPNILQCVNCTPLPVEMVIRNYITGNTSTSIWTHYQQGIRDFCGNQLPDALVKNQKLPHTILTPATKAPIGEHDVSMSREEILAQEEITAEDFDAAAEMAFKLFEYGTTVLARQNLILVDSKYEFGKTSDGQIIVIDEIHTPDSSRIWEAGSYQERFKDGLDPVSLDKDYVRHYLKSVGYNGDGPPPPLSEEVKAEAAKRYMEAFELITEEVFVPNAANPIMRMSENLRIKLIEIG